MIIRETMSPRVRAAGKGAVMPAALPKARTIALQTTGIGVTSIPRARNLARQSRPGPAPAVAEASHPLPECSISVCLLAMTASRMGAVHMTALCRLVRRSFQS